MQPSITKQKAINLRKKGYSYSMILDKLNIPKSTLSDWVRDIPYTPNQEVIKKVKNGQLKSAIFKINQKIINISNAKKLARKELGHISKRDLWLLGIGLYLGEGTKSNETIRIVNSDPEVIKIALLWFRKICKLNDENFIPRIHLYPDISINQAVSYWSKETGINQDQFAKTQVDCRTNKSSRKKGKLPYGTLSLQIKSCGEAKFGRTLHRRIMGWVEHAHNQMVYLQK